MPAFYYFINTTAQFVLKTFGPYFLFNIWAGPSNGKTIEAGPSVGKTYRPNAGKTSVGPIREIDIQSNMLQTNHYTRDQYWERNAESMQLQLRGFPLRSRKRDSDDAKV